MLNSTGAAINASQVAETGQIRDERCSDALHLLERKRLPDGGFTAEHGYYRLPRRWCRAGDRFTTGVVSVAAISTPGCPRVPLSS